MAEQEKPGQGNSPVSAPAASDAATLQMLVQLLLAERQEALSDKQERARALAAKNEQRRINAEYSVAEKNKIQAMCTHKKGGRGLKSPKTDFAVYFHTFTDATSYIRCQICGMKWRNQDTAEHLVRRGKKIENHTGIGWKQAYQMVAESTNTASASEVQLSTQPIQANVANLD
jgi:hypothetical protein